MAAQALTDAQVWYGPFDISQFTGELSTGAETDMKAANAVTCGGYKAVFPTITKAEASLSGFTDMAGNAVNAQFATSQRGRQDAFSIIPKGSTAVAGDAAIFTRGQLAKYNPLKGSTGDIAGFDLSLESDTAEIYGAVGATLVSRTVAGLTGTSVQLGAVGTGATGITQKFWAALHVTAAAGTNLAVSIQSDNAVGFPSPAAVTSFTTVSAVGWQFVTVNGPLTDDWFRVIATIASGTFTFGVTFGVF